MQDFRGQKPFHGRTEESPLTRPLASRSTSQLKSVAIENCNFVASELGDSRLVNARKRSRSPEDTPSKIYKNERDFPKTQTEAVNLLGHDYCLHETYDRPDEIPESEVNSDASTEVIGQKLDNFDLPVQNKNYSFSEDNRSDISGNFMYNSSPPCSSHPQKMYPASVDQNRQETLHPQTVHVHMHQFCSCMHPYYSSYRPPIMTPYHVPVPRPYNLQHYQYTQFNLSPYNFPVMHTNTAIAQVPPSTSTAPHLIPPGPLDFGPPPRDKRAFETNEISSQPEIIKENLFEEFGLNLPGLIDQELEHNFMATTENFTKYLEQGCIVAEKIAIRNQHRPCFKNIQNLCNRTRSEILKPSNTVSNIHSQGIPWATKDFIYAFVRLINCWHMLKGYLDSKDGTLGNIDRELTPEFKNCYLAWEKNTKELAAHMVRIFTNLDNNVSNPNAPMHKSSKTSALQENPQKPPPETPLQKLAKENGGKIGRNIAQEIIETIVLSESTGTSPRDEDSDNESRVYMKPGSYNVPKKNDSSNSSPSIEFFDTAQNVSAHYKKMARKKQDATSDKMWQDAQSAVPFLMNKMIPLQAENAGKIPGGEIEENALKYFVDLNKLDQGSNIQEWLNNNNFFENQNGSSENDAMISPKTSKPVAVLQRSSLPKLIKLVDQNANNEFSPSVRGGGCVQKGCNSVSTRTYRKRNEEKSKPSQKKNPSGIWEYDKGGLTANAIVAAEDILKNLEKEEFTKRILCATDDKEEDNDLEIPSSLSAVKRKLTSRKYNYLQEFVRDMRNLVSCSVIYYENRPDVSEQMSSFGEKFEELLSMVFPNFDFSAITGEPKEEVGPVSLRRGKKSDGDGDH